MNIYRVKLNDVLCKVDNLGELGATREYHDFDLCVVAKTNTKARTLAIRFLNEYEGARLSYTAPMRVLKQDAPVISARDLSTVEPTCYYWTECPICIEQRALCQCTPQEIDAHELQYEAWGI